VDRWLDVQAAMASLSPLERTALVLTAVQGVPYTDTAAMLGTSAGALRAAVSRARDKLAGHSRNFTLRIGPAAAD
jgi:DNA-directed RNA polymerase specialized sigma24 family protein